MFTSRLAADKSVADGIARSLPGALNIYITSGGALAVGLDNAKAGRAGELRDELVFSTDATDRTVTMTLKNGKPSVPKADKFKVVDGELVSTADNGKAIALKFTYTPKTGAFKGSFTLSEAVAGKLKKQTASFTGVFIDGIGYGTAIIKKLGLAWPVEVK